MSTQTVPSTPELRFLAATARIHTAGLVEIREGAGEMPPLHVHRDEDEGYYVVDGELTLYQPGVEVTLAAGDFFLARRGIEHTYRVGDRPATWLMTGDGGFDRFVAAVAALPAPEPATLAVVAAECGIDLLGPPGALPGAEG